MSLELKQHLKMTQQLVMTPQLQQAIKLLQLSRLELVDLIRTDINENPLLDEGPDEEERADGASPAEASAKALGLVYRLVQRQASLAAYVDNFRMLSGLAILCLPLALLFRGVRRSSAGPPEPAGE